MLHPNIQIYNTQCYNSAPQNFFQIQISSYEIAEDNKATGPGMQMEKNKDVIFVFE